MANSAKGYGFSREVESKTDTKYDEDRARRAGAWIETLTGLAAPGGSSKEMQEWLSDGFVLCSLINAIRPNSVGTFKRETMLFKKVETISKFLQAAEAHGLLNQDMFQTADLSEGLNMPQVISAIYALSRWSSKHGFTGTIIGMAEE